MSNVKKSVPFHPEILKNILNEKKMSLNELAQKIANKNNITKESEMTSLRRFNRNKQISLSALEDICEILDLDPNVLRGKEIQYVHFIHENITRKAEVSDITYQKYLDRLAAEEITNIVGLIDKEELYKFLKKTVFFNEIQKMDEAHYAYYTRLLSAEIQRLIIVTMKTDLELIRTEVYGNSHSKTMEIQEEFKIIHAPEKTPPHLEDYYVSKKR